MKQSESCGKIYLLLPAEQSAFNASLTLVRGLKNKGYEVIYTGPKKWETFVLAQGLGYFVIEPPSLPEELHVAPKGRLARWFFYRKQFKTILKLEQEYFEYCKEKLLRAKPVLLLIDPLIKAQSLLALECRIPTIALNTTIASTFDSRIPSAFGNLMPEDNPGWLMRYRYTKDWLKWLWHAWYRSFYQDKWIPLTLGLLPRRSLVRRVKRLGGGVRWGEYGPCLTVPEFVLSAKEIDLPQTIASRPRIYAGSSVDLLRDDGEYDFSWLQPGKPLVYCSLGTYSEWFRNGKQVFQSVIEALKQREDLQAIVQIGNVADAETFGELPERIRLEKRTAQLKILERADIFITHGGFSSTREGCYFGVPMMVLPYCNDGLGNATRLVYHGLGVRGDFVSMTSERVLRLLQEVQKDSYKVAASRMREHFLRQTDCLQGIEFIERFLAGDKTLQSEQEQKAWSTQFAW